MDTSLSTQRLLPKVRKKILKATKEWNSALIQSQLLQLLPNNWLDFAHKLRIISGGKVIPFIPYDYQKLLIETVENNRFTCILKSRQMGISEVLCSWLLSKALTQEGFRALIISKTQKDSSDLSDRTRKMALSLGEDCPEFESESKTRLAWRGLGSLEFLASTPRSARSIPSVSVLFIDEAAFIDKLEQIYQAAAPTLAMVEQAKIILCSTPNGKQGLFWEILSSSGDDAEQVLRKTKQIKGANAESHAFFYVHRDWAKALLHWREHPLYGASETWAKNQREKMKLTERQWNVEYELELLESGGLVFDEEAADACATGTWEDPVPGRMYICGIDPSFGGKDFWVVQVWDITNTPYRLVREYRDNHKSKDLNIGKTVDCINLYSPLYIKCESNGGGSIVAEELSKLCGGVAVHKVATTASSKLCNTDRLCLLIERRQLMYPRGCAFHVESKHFVERTSGKSRVREADSGSHDDSIMAAAIALSDIEKTYNIQWFDTLLDIE